MPNRLIHQTSPYLLQHADNPVDWYSWGEEAFAKARAEDKPLLVSIGYAACHWCHVMEHESFEDPDTAAKMNDLFVCIKVDREERPDVDGIYMQAVQALLGHGGWPLNVFVAPDGRPFYGGTYFPKQDRMGMPSWTKVLEAIADAYRNRREDVLKNASLLTQTLQQTYAPRAQQESLSFDVLRQAYVGIESLFDAEHGGFGNAPKFPNSMGLEFLLRYHARTGEEQALHMVEHSLAKMANGGIYDHLGGGFARYSTDPFWLVPHFEKMLYDNALLVTAYVQAYQAAGETFYRTVAEETIGYLLRDLRHGEGGFFSSQDADSEGVEGKFYVWSKAEIDSTLGAEDAALFNRYYGVRAAGNFEGHNILHVQDSAEAAGRDLGMSGTDLLQRLQAMREKLFAVRARRVPPATDDKVLTGWNGLALRALAEAAAVLDNDRYRQAAEENARFLLRALRPSGRLLRTWKDGKAHLNGYLEDYGLLINGLLSLHQATFAHGWLHEAKELADEMVRLFWDPEAGCFFDVGTDHEQLVVRPRDPSDNAVPSGGSAAAEALLRLSRLTGEGGYAEKAEQQLQSMPALLVRYPLGFGNWLKTAELFLAQPTEVAIVGRRDDPAARELLRTVHRAYRPNLIIAGLSPDEPEPFATPLLARRGQVGGRPTAYVCRNYACNLPATSPEELGAQLSAFSD